MSVAVAQNWLVGALQAASDVTRLRLLALLSEREFTVKDLTQILDQSQPRLSRHLKLLVEAGFLDRFQEGSWVYFRRSTKGSSAELLTVIIDSIDVAIEPYALDAKRADVLAAKHFQEAQDFFEEHAATWDEIRSAHVAEQKVEKAILSMLKDIEFKKLLDMGTGTGRMLELLQGKYKKALGIDLNRQMLSHARARLASFIGGQCCELRLADVNKPPVKDQSIDGVVFHQLMHYLSDPRSAIKQAAKVLKKDGHILIVDFATHKYEKLRELYAHQRLGFSNKQIDDWFGQSNIELVETKSLKPTATKSEFQLTVALWLGRKKG